MNVQGLLQFLQRHTHQDIIMEHVINKITKFQFFIPGWHQETTGKRPLERKLDAWITSSSLVTNIKLLVVNLRQE